MEQFISRPGSSFPCLQVVAQLHERLARGIQSKSSRWLRVMNFSKTLQFPSSRNDYTFIFLKRKVKRGSPWFTGNLGSRNSRSLVRITPNFGDRHLSVIAGTHTDSARRAQSIRQSFLTNNPLRPPDGSSISLLLSGGLKYSFVTIKIKFFLQLFLLPQPRSWARVFLSAVI